MRCRSFLLALAVSAVSVAAAQGAALVSLNRVGLPVYYDDSAVEGHLEVEIAQKSYGEGRPTARYEGFLANITIEDRKESVTAEEVVIRYVEHLLKEDYEPIARLYVPGVDTAAAAARARSLRDQLVGLSQINFLSEWFYQDAKFLLVDFRFEGGASRTIGFGFRNTPKGFLLSLGGNDDEGLVLDLFDYLAETVARDRTTAYTTRPFEHSIALGEGLFGISLKVDGRLHEARQAWRPPRGAAAPSGPAAFAELVLARSAALNDEALARLWCAGDAATPADAAARKGVAPAGAMQGDAAVGRIKHLMTLAFGEDFAHYFVEESDPARIRSMFVGTAGDGFCLSRGPDDRRVRGLLRSEVVKDGVWALWVAQRGS